MRRLTRENVQRMIAGYDADYKRAAGTDFDPTNGTAQIPDGNTAAAEAYGAIRALEALLWG